MRLRFSIRIVCSLGAAIAMTLALCGPLPARATTNSEQPAPPKPVPAAPRADRKLLKAPAPVSPKAAAAAQAERLRTVAAVKSWGVQMQDLHVTRAAAAPVDMLVVDATSGAEGGRPLTTADVQALKAKPDGSRRLAISYLSIGEAEDYRPDYFTSEYMEEDAPDWLLKENKQWKGNRLIRFCKEGWQRTILGDDDGRSVYNSVEPSPLYKLIELGFDGVYLDRVDVYNEVQSECPDAATKMVDFVARLAAHARKKNPNFIVILQNAEELLQKPKMIASIDAIAKEDLFYGASRDQHENDASMVKTVLANLDLAKTAGRPVFVLDYLNDQHRRATDKARIEAQGFIPAFGPRKLNELWLPGIQY